MFKEYPWKCHPVAKIPDNFTCAADYLDHLCQQSLMRKFTYPLRQAAEQLFLEEMDLVKKEDISDFILIVYELFQTLRSYNNQFVMLRTPSYSMIAYLLQMTPVDPLDFSDLVNPHTMKSRFFRKNNAVTLDFSGVDGSSYAKNFLMQAYGQSYVASLMAYGYSWRKTEGLVLGQSLRRSTFAISGASLEHVCKKSDEGISIFIGTLDDMYKLNFLVFTFLDRCPLLNGFLEKLQSQNYRGNMASFLSLDLNDSATYSQRTLKMWHDDYRELFNQETTLSTEGNPPRCFKDLVVWFSQEKIKPFGGFENWLGWFAVLLFWYAYAQTHKCEEIDASSVFNKQGESYE